MEIKIYFRGSPMPDRVFLTEEQYKGLLDAIDKKERKWVAPDGTPVYLGAVLGVAVAE